jgi:hypothetical protein
MKIRLKTLMAGPDGVATPGSVIEASDDEARMLIDGGFAEAVQRVAGSAHAETSAVETAAFEPGNRAVKPPARPRKTP